MAHVRERERQSDLLPLRQAVFQFGIQDEGDSTEPSHSQPLDLIDLIQTEVTGSGATFSLDELEKVLGETAQAKVAKIDPIACTFSFTFADGDVAGGQPWVILDGPSDKGIKVNQRFEAEALFNKEGFVYIADDEGVALRAKQLDAILYATGLVWRQFMLRDFDRAVSAGQWTLYARIDSTLGPIKQLPADIWPILDIVDWRNGIACDPQGVLYYSIHAANVSEKSQKPVANKATERQVCSFFENRVKGWNPNGPFPTFDEDHAVTQAAVGFVSQKLMRRVRKKICEAHGYDETNWLKRGPRDKQLQQSASHR